MRFALKDRLGLRSVFCLAAILVYPSLSSGVLAQSPPIEASASPADPIVDMHLLTPESGWVFRLRHLLWTETAGRIWKDITPPLEGPRVLGGVQFLDAEHGWAVLSTMDAVEPYPISVAVTVDGGKFWSVVSIQNTNAGYYTGGCLSFADEKHGWLLMEAHLSSAASGGDPFGTSDGGATWSPLPQPPIGGRIQFFPDKSGWLVGGVHKDELYRTRDGGHTWSLKTIPLPKEAQPYVLPETKYVTRTPYTGPYFSTEQKGVIEVSVATSELKRRSLIYATADGGDTWLLQKIDFDPDLIRSGSLAFFESGFVEIGCPGGTNSGIASFRPFSLKQTAENSQPVKTRLPFKRSTVLEANFMDAMRGWLLMTDDSLIGTADGGKTLTVLIPSD